jgi:hypothetical protein
MSKYKLIVMTNAVEGRDSEFNDWYTNRHLADVVGVPGFASAQRLKLHSQVAGRFENKYLAIYTIDAADPQQALAALQTFGDSGQMYISESLDRDTVNCAVFEVCSAEVTAPKSST